MIKDMYAVMGRINDIQKRFGTMRHNVSAQEKKTTTFEQTMEMVNAKNSSEKISLEKPAVHDINRIADHYARVNKISPDLVKAVIAQESAYNHKAVSPKGARGLMQLMPSVIKDMHVKDPFAPEENIRAGVGYLKSLLDKYNGDYKKALAAYNAGPAVVDKKGGVPPYPETKEYIRKVIDSYLENSNDQ